MLNIKKFAITIIIITLICYLWIGLEWLIDGKIVNRLVDNIMMLIMSVYIWFTVNYFVDKKERIKRLQKGRKEKRKERA